MKTNLSIVLAAGLAVGVATSVRADEWTWTAAGGKPDTWGIAANWASAKGDTPDNHQDTIVSFTGVNAPYWSRANVINTFKLNTMKFDTTFAGKSLFSDNLLGQLIDANPDGKTGTLNLVADKDGKAPTLVQAGSGGGITNLWNPLVLAGTATYKGEGKDRLFIGDNRGDDRKRGVISGPGGLTVDSAGTLGLYGDNTYKGDTTLKNGFLIAGGDRAFGDGTLVLEGGRLRAGKSPVITLANKVTMSGDVIFGDKTDNTRLNLDGIVTVVGDRTFTVESKTEGLNLANVTSTLNLRGDIFGGAATSIIKKGHGKMTLGNLPQAKNHAFTGSIDVHEGFLVVDGVFGVNNWPLYKPGDLDPLKTVTVQPPVEKKYPTGLIGNGVLFSEKQEGNRPGVRVSKDGVTKGGKSPGLLTIGGGLEMDPGAIMLADIASPVPVTGYSQISLVGDTADLGYLGSEALIDGAVLRPRLLSDPGDSEVWGGKFEQQFMTLCLLQKDGTGPIQGLFTDSRNGKPIPEGGNILLRSPTGDFWKFTASYQHDFDNGGYGGVGNDFVLRAPVWVGIPAPGPAALLGLAGLIATQRRR